MSSGIPLLLYLGVSGTSSHRLGGSRKPPTNPPPTPPKTTPATTPSPATSLPSEKHSPAHPRKAEPPRTRAPMLAPMRKPTPRFFPTSTSIFVKSEIRNEPIVFRRGPRSWRARVVGVNSWRVPTVQPAPNRGAKTLKVEPRARESLCVASCAAKLGPSHRRRMARRKPLMFPRCPPKGADEVAEFPRAMQIGRNGTESTCIWLLRESKFRHRAPTRRSSRTENVAYGPKQLPSASTNSTDTPMSFRFLLTF